MPSRVVLRSAVVAACLSLLVSGVASADVVAADAVEPGTGTFVDLGQTGPGGQVTFDVDFLLTCRNGTHPPRGSTIQLGLASAVVPDGGAVTVVPGAIGPIPDDWPLDGETCFGSPTLASSTPAEVTITAPTAVQDDYLFTIIFSRSPSTGLSGSTAVSAQIDVVGNTPPVLDLPGPFTVEGDTHGGWTADYAVSADDAEDDPDPVVSCSPAVGDVLPVGVTTVECSVTDGGGMSDSGSFEVTVVDTQAPSLSGVPGDRTVATAGSSAVVVYAAPTATDVVDPSPSVDCAPASGSAFPLGSTTVTCTATDGDGNAASATFVVTVVGAAAVFDQPVGNGGSFTVSGSRTIPIKVLLYRDGVEVTTGDPWIWVAPCGGQAIRMGRLDRQAGRWQGHLDTSGFAAGCHQVMIRSGGVSFGGFELRIEGATTATQARPRKGS